MEQFTGHFGGWSRTPSRRAITHPLEIPSELYVVSFQIPGIRQFAGLRAALGQGLAPRQATHTRGGVHQGTMWPAGPPRRCTTHGKAPSEGRHDGTIRPVGPLRSVRLPRLSRPHQKGRSSTSPRVRDHTDLGVLAWPSQKRQHSPACAPQGLGAPPQGRRLGCPGVPRTQCALESPEVRHTSNWRSASESLGDLC